MSTDRVSNPIPDHRSIGLRRDQSAIDSETRPVTDRLSIRVVGDRSQSRVVGVDGGSATESRDTTPATPYDSWERNRMTPAQRRYRAIGEDPNWTPSACVVVGKVTLVWKSADGAYIRTHDTHWPDAEYHEWRVRNRLESLG